ncbi:GTP-binding protein, partial [Streptococcus pneumoniae]|nr:GTP-binding protein [Streptococcus pneumoniae]
SVTEIAGTTRDIIEEYVNVRGVPLRLVDTAGIRETEDIVERIGVERSRKVLKEADLILYVLNYAEALTEEDLLLFEAVRDMNYIVVINKTDLPKQIDLDQVKELTSDKRLVTTSLIEEEGIDQLEEAIAELFFEGEIEAG